MVNMTVVRGKDMIRYLVGVTLLLALVMVITRYFSNEEVKESWKVDLEATTDKIESSSWISCMEETLPTIAVKETQEETDNTFIEKILNVELAMTKNVKSKKQVETQEVPKEEKQEALVEAQTDVETEVVDNSGIQNKYTNTYGSVQIKNESKYELTEEMLTPDIELNDKTDILLFHTHTCESYTSSEQYTYEPTGTFRTTDLNFSVARVGTELKKYLDGYGYQVTHDTTYHDYPAYTGSYNRSLTTVKNDLAAKEETEIVFDIHRDAIGSKSDYAPTVKIGEEYAAQIMFVIGTDGGGLNHPNWNQNLKFAIKIQEKANEMYPGLFKPIILRNSRYNQHVTRAASIIEVGATGNTLEQTLVSMKYLAKVISEVVK